MSILPDPYSTLRNIPAKPSGSLRSAGLVTQQCAFGAAAAAAFHSLSSFVQGLGDGDPDRDGATRASESDSGVSNRLWREPPETALLVTDELCKEVLVFFVLVTRSSRLVRKIEPWRTARPQEL